MNIINNGTRNFDIPAGASLTLRQASSGATAIAAQVWADGVTGFTTAFLTSSTPVTIGPFAANARILVNCQGSVSVDSVGSSSGGTLPAMDISGSPTLDGDTYANRHLSWTGVAPVTITLGTGSAGQGLEITNDSTTPGAIITFAGVSAASIAAGMKTTCAPGETWGSLYSLGNWDSIAAPFALNAIITLAGGPITCPNDTVDNLLVTIPIPANSMGPNGWLRYKTWWTRSANSVGVLTTKTYFDGNAIDDSRNMATTDRAFQTARNIMNQGAANSQVYWTKFASEPVSDGSTTTALNTLAVDTTVVKNLTIRAQNASAEATTIKLQKWIVEIGYGA